MTRFLFAAAAASLTFATPALANDRAFKHEGVTYTYSAAQKGDARVIEGTNSERGKFKLTIRNGWVHGHVGGVPVSFRAPKAGTVTTLAAR